MSFQLDPNVLASITQEARQCFLDEDAPEYLQTLIEGLQQRDRGSASEADRSPDFTSLLRAAHSLKGGAGLAGIPSLQELAHKLEDVLKLLEQGDIAEIDLGWDLVSQTIDETSFVLTQARTVSEVLVDPQLIATLEAFIQLDSTTDKNQDNNQDRPTQRQNQINDLIIKALNEDLETQLLEIEELDGDLPEEIIRQALANFYDECLFLSETLDLPWLAETVSAAETLTSDTEAIDALLVTKEIIAEIRNQRDLYLTEPLNSDLETDRSDSQSDSQNNSFVINALNEDLEGIIEEVERLDDNLPEEVIKQGLVNFHDECLFLSETLDLPWLAAKISPLEEVLAVFPPFQLLLLAKEIIAELRSQKTEYLQEITAEVTAATEEKFLPDSDEEETPSSIFNADRSNLVTTPSKTKTQLRIPLQKIENMTNNVEELIIIESRLNLGQKQLQQAQKRLQKLNSQFEPIREQVQIFYNQLAIDATGLGMTTKDAPFPHFPISPFPPSRTNEAQRGQGREFDSLELDRYTELHSSLQSFQELMLQIQETRRDIELINRNSLENLEQVRKNLSGLYNNVKESRLVPFKVLAQRFIPQIQSLNRRYNKSVVLDIQGEDTLIDQVLLEQLQTPLTHLLNNAFDHGIEFAEERIANGKLETAHILLQAAVKNNQLEIALQDDGRGINLSKVYQKAVEQRICSPDVEFEQLTSKEILNWIFQPEFSTAEQVSDISGRGMGMDIVRSQIIKLRGGLEVDTKLHCGTSFTLKLPLNISLVSLLVVQLQNRLLAIPSSSVRETLLYEELPMIDWENPTLRWQKQPIPLASISELLPCPREPITVGQPKVAIILEAGFGYFAIAVDSLVSVENLIVRPFDDTVPIPSYIAGCTILGTGEVVPVILPQGFELSKLRTTSANDTSTNQNQHTVPTIMVAEDSVATRKLLEKIFTSVGCDVILCRDGQEAMEQFALHYEKISVVISDVEMPRRNGFELLESIKNHFQGKTIPVIMVTSRTGDRHRQKAQKLGANGYLGKPIQPQELLTTITPFIS